MGLPVLKSREEMLDILQKEEYGYIPPKPQDQNFIVEHNISKWFCAGKAVMDRVTYKAQINGKHVEFPFICVLPTATGKHPFFIHINFRSCVPDKYMPTEEIVDHGFAVLSFGYEDVTTDNNDFSNNLAGCFYEDGRQKESSDAGKIALWSWAAQRVMDYAYTLDSLDFNHSAVCGHSRLGKTALLTAAYDERFRFAFSNDSGCSGAALSREKTGEHIKDIVDRFPFWFCKNYRAYADKEDKMPFDQHYLLSCIYPRHVYVGSAENDLWSDPKSEFLCLKYVEGFFGDHVLPESMPEADAHYFGNKIGYHIRKGEHYFSRYDWNKYMEFMRRGSVPKTKTMRKFAELSDIRLNY